MEDSNFEVAEIDIKQLLFAILQKWWLVALISIVGVASAWGYTRNFVTPLYASTSMLYVINRQSGEMTTMSDLQFGNYIAQDLKILVKSRPVTEEVIRKLNAGISANQLANLISVSTSTDTRFMKITVYHPDPYLAKELVDTVAAVSSESLVSVMQMEKVDVVEEGNLPMYPSSPNMMKNMILGGLAGALLTSAIIVIVHLLNDTIKTSEEIEKFLGITTLGIIPVEQITNKKGHKHRVSKKKEKDALAS